MKIIKLAINCGALTKKDGQEKAPDKILEKIKDYYLKENGLLPFIEEDKISINNSNLEESHAKISNFVKKNDVPVCLLGGDHSLTYASFKEFSKKYKNPGLLVFDAHLDLMNNFKPPTHEDYLRVLIEDKHLNPKNVVIVGVRNIHQNELEFAKKNKIRVFDMKKISQNGVHEISETIMQTCRKFDALYVSVDIDVLDPAFAPGTGYNEPGGLTTRELIYFIQRIKNLKNIKMWDLVEVNPDKDINENTICVAAKLLVEII
jgi:agmatinase